jgi:hypothetical protein
LGAACLNSPKVIFTEPLGNCSKTRAIERERLALAGGGRNIRFCRGGGKLAISGAIKTVIRSPEGISSEPGGGPGAVAAAGLGAERAVDCGARGSEVGAAAVDSLIGPVAAGLLLSGLENNLLSTPNIGY